MLVGSFLKPGDLIVALRLLPRAAASVSWNVSLSGASAVPGPLSRSGTRFLVGLAAWCGPGG